MPLRGTSWEIATAQLVFLEVTILGSWCCVMLRRVSAVLLLHCWQIRMRWAGWGAVHGVMYICGAWYRCCVRSVVVGHMCASWDVCTDDSIEEPPRHVDMGRW